MIKYEEFIERWSIPDHPFEGDDSDQFNNIALAVSRVDKEARVLFSDKVRIYWRWRTNSERLTDVIRSFLIDKDMIEVNKND